VILIVVKHPVRPEYADTWVTLVDEFTSATRAEPGNISVEWFRSVEDRNLDVLVEAFRDEAAGRAHVESARFRSAIAQLPTWLADVPDIIHVDAPGDGWSRMSELQFEPDR
jgi:quinol monooxygenase YgiN